MSKNAEPTSIPLPRRTVERFEEAKHQGEVNVGLHLDKFIHPLAEGHAEWTQGHSLRRLLEQPFEQPKLLEAVLARRDGMLVALKARRFSAKTVGPLTLHLARASALENAGICLHRVYGFVYFPGSGLKGMARAYATEAWLAAEDNEDNKKAAWEKILAVFGNPPPKSVNPITGKQADKTAFHAGQVVFHDAWPTKWPTLHVDIVNCHHRDYYDGEDAPGDWENPVPVSFLAVGSGEEFDFALSKRSDSVPDELLKLAKEWLLGALCHFGAGAKTAAGYGAFEPTKEETPALHLSEADPKYATFEETLELVTPAFLAGADQKAHDCDLRPATLRGLLRWWWRTMHAGFLDVGTLRKLEAAIWGDTKRGGAVTVRVRHLAETRGKALQFDKQEQARASGLVRPPNNKTTQGLWYHSFGMDDTKTVDGRKTRFQRHYRPAGETWRVELTARDVAFGGAGGSQRKMSAEQVLAQAKAALWLLCAYGGVGSKSRKGFGSFRSVGYTDFDGCRRTGLALRKHLGVHQPFAQERAHSPALEQRVFRRGPFRLPWTDEWFAVDQVGFAMQAFAQGRKHDPAKYALGLPRNVKVTGQVASELIPRDSKGQPIVRHASPIHIHFDRGQDGGLTLEIVAFIARYLPNPVRSQQLLVELANHLTDDIARRTREYGDKGTKRAGRPAGPAPNRNMRPAGAPTPWSNVECVLLEERTKNGGWKARVKDGEGSGHIENGAAAPGDLKAGEVVDLIVKSVSTSDIVFLWPTDDARKQQDRARQAPAKPPGKGGPGKPPYGRGGPRR